ncbi:hypothetical protein GCM10010156_03750 [Planobispora rosea]|uniref:Uncharacterized protein n=1 Tax=Planobispora rosea TaxID=35762 RepID=A0A8J3WAS0_PLARO|nr:hypothetical protein GCM10010156_03750 [Planobispora rosea]GIH82112.1 hypothetical protein Pro02_05200 [Planobispora rosea]
MNFETFGGGMRTGLGPLGIVTGARAAGVGVAAGSVAVTELWAAAESAGAGGCVLMPATPPGDAHAAVTRMVPAAVANRVVCPDRMVSTRIRYR